MSVLESCGQALLYGRKVEFRMRSFGIEVQGYYNNDNSNNNNNSDSFLLF